LSLRNDSVQVQSLSNLWHADYLSWDYQLQLVVLLDDNNKHPTGCHCGTPAVAVAVVAVVAAKRSCWMGMTQIAALLQLLLHVVKNYSNLKKRDKEKV
jgi:hypothetical protein